MNENILLLCVGLACLGEDRDYSFIGFANEDETPYDFSTRILALGYTRVTTVPLWRLPQFPKAWQMFLERNREVSVRYE